MAVDGNNIRQMIDFVNETGLGSIGTVDDAVAQIERLLKQSNGGFGAYLLLAHEWANPAATNRSYELIAQHVLPEFQGQGWSTREARARAKGARPTLAAAHMKAVEDVTAKYAALVAGAAETR
jgi:limonene 1,2-monooxygenase